MKRGVIFEALIVTLIIILSFILMLSLADGSPDKTEKLELSDISPFSQMFTDRQDNLCVFSENEIICIDRKGSVKWNMSVPANYTMINEWCYLLPSRVERDAGSATYVCPCFASDDGIFYVHIKPLTVIWEQIDLTHSKGIPVPINRTGLEDNDSAERLIAIGPTGKILWDRPIQRGSHEYGDLENDIAYDDINIHASDGRVYVFHPWNLTVMDKNGKILFNIEGVSNPPAIDDNGNIYVIEAVRSQYDWVNKYSPNYMGPGSIIKAYSQDGELLWIKDAGENISRQWFDRGIWHEYRSLPLYRNGLLYVPLNDGIITMDPNGDVVWEQRFDRGTFSIFGSMPFDKENNLYIMHANDTSYVDSYGIYRYTLPEPNIYVISPEGDCTFGMSWGNNGYYLCAGNGTGYTFSGDNHATGGNLDDLTTLRLTATDIRTGNILWSRDMPVDIKKNITITHENVVSIFGEWQSEHILYYNKNDLDPSNKAFSLRGADRYTEGYSFIRVCPGDELVYVNFYSYKYDCPVILNESRVVYSSWLYAFNESGEPVWQMFSDSFVTGMTAGNGTLYYNTLGGKLSAAKMPIAAGFAAATLIYLFTRFFLIGAISRAKNRLKDNDNRLALLEYLKTYPGPTLYDICRTTGINMGTVRYHLLILEMNHKVVSVRSDGKFVRYFPNSGAYCEKEQLVISMIKRASIKEILKLLTDKPGITNIEISRTLKISDSSVSNYFKELTEKGIVIKNTSCNGRHVYLIRPEYAVYVSRHV